MIKKLHHRIRPPLQLSDLQNGASPTEETGSRGLSETQAAYRHAVDEVRASLRLPMEPLASQASESAADRLAMLQNARDLARAVASAAPTHADRSEALPLSRSEQTDADASRSPIASVGDLGRLVREARERRGLSQQAFADLVGVGRRFISELENGKATLELGKVLQVASAAGIDVLARPRR